MPFAPPAFASQAGPGGTVPTPTDTAPSGLPPSIGVPGLGPAKSPIMPYPEVPGNGPNGRVMVAGGPAPFGIPASFGVSTNTGVLTYTVPIDVPPGVAGMQPKLSLQYNSSAGNGQLGVGWSLAGLDSITRCPQTIATNGVAGGVNDDGNDRFCLDGQQLIAVPAPGSSNLCLDGSHGTTYAKEIDDFSEVYTCDGNAVSPGYFMVHTKSGLTLEFGNTSASANSQVLSASGAVTETWALDKVTDQQSNYMTISYSATPVPGDASQGTIYPTQVSYAGNTAAGTLPTNSVVFNWQTRTDAPVLYGAGTPHEMQDRLASISTKVGSTLVSNYTLAYNYGYSTERSKLLTITKNDGSSPPNVLPALTFTYSDAQISVQSGVDIPVQSDIDVQPDLITSISNGFGATTNISYLPGTSPTVDTIGLNAAGEGGEISSTAPTTSVVYKVQQVIPVIGYSGVNLANTNTSYTTNYSFASPEIDLYGRGNLGFVNSSIADLQTGFSFAEAFLHGFPLIGDPSWVVELLPGGGYPTGCEDCFQNTYGYVTSAQGTSFPYMSQSIETRNDIKPGTNYASPVTSGTLPTITRNYTYDLSGPVIASKSTSWGNLLQATTTTSDGYSDQQAMTYQSPINTTNWLPELVTAFSDTAQGMAGPAQTRTTNFAYGNASNCTAPNEICSVVTQQGAAGNIQSTATYSYDNFGNVLSKTISGSDLNGSNPTTSVTYDGQGQFPTSLTNPLGQTEHYSTDARFGLLTSLTDINNQTTNYQYDNFGRLDRKTNPDGSFTATQYDDLYSSPCCWVPYGGPAAAAILQQTFASDGATQIAPDVNKNYDAIGRDVYDDVQTFSACSSYSYFARTSHIYDANGNLAQVTTPYCYVGPATFTTNTYDELGRVIQTVNPDNSVDTTSYAGQTVTATNGLGQISTVYKDGHGNVSWSQDSIGDKISFLYDGFDQRTQVTDQGGNVTTYNYDILGRQVSGVDPDKGAWGASYNSLGELIGTNDADGNSATRSYDLLGRMHQRIEYDAAGNVSLNSLWIYDTATNGVGELASETASGTASPSGQANVVGYTKTYTYDSYGRQSQTSVTEPLPWAPTQTGTFTQNYGYDSASRPLTISTGWGDGLTSTYNFLGYPLAKVQTATGNAIWSETSADAANSITGAEYGSTIGQTFTYDIDERMTGITATSSAYTSPLESINYTYDVLNNVVTKTNNAMVIQNAPLEISTPITENYSYDGLDRLCAVNPGSTNLATQVGPTQPCPSQPAALTTVGVGVTYDALGDITSKLGNGGVGTYTYSGPKPHAVTSISGSSVNTNAALGYQSFTYDADGNMLRGFPDSVSYTAFGMPQQICLLNLCGTNAYATTSFAYGPDHERVSQTQTGTGAMDMLYLDDMNVTAAPGASTGTVYSYVKDNKGSLVAQIARTGVTNLASNATSSGTPAVQFMVNDWQNSVAILTNAAGTLLSAQGYDPWGQICQAANCAPELYPASNTVYGYTNQEELNNVYLINLNARLYNPYIGSMLSVDPAVANWADPQSWNAYAYARNNPLRYTDPTGKCIEDLCIGETLLAYAILTTGIAAAEEYYQNRGLPSDGPQGGQPLEARSKPDGPDPNANGNPHSVPDGNGGYTTYGPNDPITGQPDSLKQYRPVGKPHGSIPRPNVKEWPAKTRPDGAKLPGKPSVRPPHPDEIRQPPQAPPSPPSSSPPPQSIVAPPPPPPPTMTPPSDTPPVQPNGPVA